MPFPHFSRHTGVGLPPLFPFSSLMKRPPEWNAGADTPGPQRPHDFYAVDNARSVIVRPFPDVPTVEVLYDDVAVRMHRPLEFRDDIGLLLVFVQNTAHLQANPHLVASLDQPAMRRESTVLSAAAGTFRISSS